MGGRPRGAEVLRGPRHCIGLELPGVTATGAAHAGEEHAQVLFPAVPGPGRWQLDDGPEGPALGWHRQPVAADTLQEMSALQGGLAAGGAGAGASRTTPHVMPGRGSRDAAPPLSRMAQLCAG